MSTLIRTDQIENKLHFVQADAILRQKYSFPGASESEHDNVILVQSHELQFKPHEVRDSVWPSAKWAKNNSNILL